MEHKVVNTSQDDVDAVMILIRNLFNYISLCREFFVVLLYTSMKI